VLALFTHGPGIVFNTKRPIAKVDDLRAEVPRGRRHGQRDLQVAGHERHAQAGAGKYELLSTGVMDGTLFPAESTESFKIDKIIKPCHHLPGRPVQHQLRVHDEPGQVRQAAPDEKKAVDAMSGEFAARMFGRGWDKVDRRGLALMQANGVQWSPRPMPSSWPTSRQRPLPLEQAWIKSAEAKGLKNAAKVLAEFRAEIAKLEK
jgi:hypothetical protein